MSVRLFSLLDAELLESYRLDSGIAFSVAELDVFASTIDSDSELSSYLDSVRSYVSHLSDSELLWLSLCAGSCVASFELSARSSADSP